MELRGVGICWGCWGWVWSFIFVLFVVCFDFCVVWGFGVVFLVFLVSLGCFLLGWLNFGLVVNCG